MSQPQSDETAAQLRECQGHFRRLRDEMTLWLRQSVRLDRPGPHGGGEDELNHALAFVPHFLVTGEPAVIERLRELIGDMAAWIQAEGHHGYEAEAEAHHGTEPFVLLLPRYLGLAPDDDSARFLLEDAAHHIGNWVEGVPPWYDYEHERFYSYHLGTRVVDRDPERTMETAEHFRFIHMALAAHRVLGEERYAEWALRYGRRRAETILQDETIPLMRDNTGRPVAENKVKTDGLRTVASSHHHVAGDPLAGVENLLASGAIYALGDLYTLSGDDVFRQAARRIAEPLLSELLDPYAAPGAAAVGYYRWAFRDDALDDRIREVIARMPPEHEGDLAMVLPEAWRRREPGVGKRADMIYWGEWLDDGSVRPTREPCTAALTLAWQMTGEVGFARRALKAAATKLMMGRRVLRGGRDHACGAGTICAVAAGHGRNWGQGVVTGCYGPLALGTREIFSRVSPTIEVRDDAGRDRAPEQVLPLVNPPIMGAGEILFQNGSDAPVSLSWRRAGGSWQAVELGPSESRRFPLPA